MCLFQNIARTESKLPPVPAAEVLGATLGWDHLRSQQQQLSGKVNGAAWGHIFGKQDCNRAGGSPRALLTHARQNTLPKQLSRSQPQWTATWKRRGALLVFLNWVLTTGDSEPHSPNASHSADSGTFTQKARVVTFWNFIWEQLGPGSEDHPPRGWYRNHFAFTNYNTWVQGLAGSVTTGRSAIGAVLWAPARLASLSPTRPPPASLLPRTRQVLQSSAVTFSTKAKLSTILPTGRLRHRGRSLWKLHEHLLLKRKKKSLSLRQFSFIGQLTLKNSILEWLDHQQQLIITEFALKG